MNLILSVNAGSSSLKLSLYQFTKDSRSLKPLLTASISNISSPEPAFSAEDLTSESGDLSTKQKPREGEIGSHHAAFQYFLQYLKGTNHKLEDITHLCHRVVHGGTYTRPTLITDESYHHIEELSDLAPL
jgi:acetate kinase